jgi:hypothetical protein
MVYETQPSYLDQEAYEAYLSAILLQAQDNPDGPQVSTDPNNKLSFREIVRRLNEACAQLRAANRLLAEAVAEFHKYNVDTTIHRTEALGPW